MEKLHIQMTDDEIDKLNCNQLCHEVIKRRLMMNGYVRDEIALMMLPDYSDFLRTVQFMVNDWVMNGWGERVEIYYERHSVVTVVFVGDYKAGGPDRFRYEGKGPSLEEAVMKAYLKALGF